MRHLSPEICFEIKKARRAAKLSQSELAAEMGCNQSALSMFENGQVTKLNEEMVTKIAGKLGVEFGGDGKSAAIQMAMPGRIVGSGFCPNPACPSNGRYQVDGVEFVLPDRSKCDPVGGRFCAFCGEILERRCPNCGAPVHAGAVCSLCGEKYIAV